MYSDLLSEIRIVNATISIRYILSVDFLENFKLSTSNFEFNSLAPRAGCTRTNI